MPSERHHMLYEKWVWLLIAKCMIKISKARVSLSFRIKTRNNSTLLLASFYSKAPGEEDASRYRWHVGAREWQRVAKLNTWFRDLNVHMRDGPACAPPPHEDGCNAAVAMATDARHRHRGRYRGNVPTTPGTCLPIHPMRIFNPPTFNPFEFLRSTKIP